MAAPIRIKCGITGCIYMAKSIPVLTVACSSIKTKMWFAPMVMTAKDPVCDNHRSYKVDDYVTRDEGFRLIHQAQSKGMQLHWHMCRVRFKPLNWKENHGKKMTIHDLTSTKGVDITWQDLTKLPKLS